jgi:peptidoglycan/xylan/chitin deacetylase (PgdA/CDA1 family)
MEEMVASGLIDIQAHSKTHANLAYRLPGEDEAHYRKRLDAEVRVPRDILQSKLREHVSSFAYPYGDTNGVVMDLLAKAEYQLAVTVHPGANAFFAYPLTLNRSMIFGDDDIDAFKAKLQTYRQVDLQ